MPQIPELNPFPEKTLFSDVRYWQLFKAAKLKRVFQPSDSIQRRGLMACGLPNPSQSPEVEARRIYWMDQHDWIVWTDGPYVALEWNAIPLIGKKATKYCPNIDGLLYSSVMRLSPKTKSGVGRLNHQEMIKLALGAEDFIQPTDDFWVQADFPSYVGSNVTDQTGLISLAVLPAQEYWRQFLEHQREFNQTVAKAQRAGNGRQDPLVQADVPRYVLSERNTPQAAILPLSEYKVAFRNHKSAVQGNLNSLR